MRLRRHSCAMGSLVWSTHITLSDSGRDGSEDSFRALDSLAMAYLCKCDSDYETIANNSSDGGVIPRLSYNADVRP